MTLGVLKVAASVRCCGLDVRVVDLSGQADFMAHVQAASDSCPAGPFAITATTPQFPHAYKIANFLRQRGHKVIMGGPHPTLVMGAHLRGIKRAAYHASVLESCADTVVSGDGEMAIFKALAQDGHINADDVKSTMFMSHSQFDTSPWPARDLLDVSSYHYEIDGKRALSVVGQLGCPMACTFCAGRNSPSFRRIRLRSAKSVVQEIEHLVTEYGVEAIMFYDDELNINNAFSDLMLALVDLQDRLGKVLAFRGFVKAELFTAAQARLMARAGFKTLLSGFESGSPRILENINKKASVDDNTRCLDVARNNNIKVKALMSLGHAGETPETVQQTREWLLKTRPDDFDVTIITVLPGSPYFDQSEPAFGAWRYTAKNGDTLYSHDIDYSVTKNYYKGIPGEYTSYVFTDRVTECQLVMARDAMETDIRAALGLPALTPAAKAFDQSMGASRPA